MFDFHGPLTDDMRREAHELYLSRPARVRILLALLAAACLAFALRTTLTGGGPDWPLLAYSAGILFLAVRLQHMWLRWWWLRMEKLFHDGIAGRITEEGIHLSATDGSFLVPWQQTDSAEVGQATVLLFVSRRYAYPVHRSMFADDAHWSAFLSELRERSLVRADT